MRTMNWKPICGGDQYAQTGYSGYIVGPSWAYYWNEDRKVLRRYGLGGEYEEFNRRLRPVAFSVGLLDTLSGLFATARKAGRVRAEGIDA